MFGLLATVAAKRRIRPRSVVSVFGNEQRPPPRHCYDVACVVLFPTSYKQRQCGWPGCHCCKRNAAKNSASASRDRVLRKDAVLSTPKRRSALYFFFSSYVYTKNTLRCAYTKIPTHTARHEARLDSAVVPFGYAIHPARRRGR
ncbi:hypothetical protein MRX96_050866 [Rhipicephalus microplus]